MQMGQNPRNTTHVALAAFALVTLWGLIEASWSKG